MTVHNRLGGKTAFVTGIGRGQGRSHALRLAREGAAIVGLDICAPIGNVNVSTATKEDLAETVRQVEALGGRIIARVADVRSQQAVDTVVTEGMAEFGQIDIVSANAGTGTLGPLWECTDEQWQTTLDVNLNGAFHTAKAVIPHMIEAGRGGSLIFTASVAGLRPLIGMGAYTASKHGILGLMKNLAAELGPYGIRSNAICPGNTRTPMAMDAFEEFMKPELQTEGDPDWKPKLDAYLKSLNPLDVALVEPEDQTNALLWLASDDSRYVTGQAIAIDAGWSVWMK